MKYSKLPYMNTKCRYDKSPVTEYTDVRENVLCGKCFACAIHFGNTYRGFWISDDGSWRLDSDIPFHVYGACNLRINFAILISCFCFNNFEKQSVVDRFGQPISCLINKRDFSNLWIGLLQKA